MERSRADRILSDWDRVSRQASRPAVPPRTVVTTALPGPALAGVVALVVAIAAASIWLALPRGGGPPGVGTSPSPTGVWGPLAVVPPSDLVMEARAVGTLHITDTCVFLETAGDELTLLVWPADRTTWNGATQTISLADLDGSTVTLRDGDRVALGGGGDSVAESGVSGEEWVRRTEWVAQPAASCPLDSRWLVGEKGSLVEPSASPVEPSASPVEPSASQVETWGPLAVIPPRDGTDLAQNEGTLRITDACVYLQDPGGDLWLLVWPADRTTWSEESRSITFENYAAFDGSVATVVDGDRVVLGGGGSSGAESGISGEEWVSRIDWVAPPSFSCSLDLRFFVGVVGD